MDAHTRLRFVRHILLPEIGESGQERLSQTRFVHDNAWTTTYLRRAGLTVDASHSTDRSDERSWSTADAKSSPAERALLGTLKAVERIKEVLDLGTPTPMMKYEHIIHSRD